MKINVGSKVMYRGYGHYEEDGFHGVCEVISSVLVEGVQYITVKSKTHRHHTPATDWCNVRNIKSIGYQRITEKKVSNGIQQQIKKSR